MATSGNKVFLLGSFVTDSGEYCTDPIPLLDEGAFLTREAAQAEIDVRKAALTKNRLDSYAASKARHDLRVEDAAVIYEKSLAEHNALLTAGLRKANQIPQKPVILVEEFTTEEEWMDLPFNKNFNDLTVIEVRVN